MDGKGRLHEDYVWEKEIQNNCGNSGWMRGGGGGGGAGN